MTLDNQKSINNWLSEGFRLTTFISAPEKADPFKWWDKVVGEVPEKQNSLPKIGNFQFEGPYSGGQLVMSGQPSRVDWVFFPAFDSQIGMPNFEELSPYQSNKELFLQLTSRWLEICPMIKRLAFGLILYEPVPDRVTGYRKLSERLSTVQIDPDNSTDLLYQINRRRSSKIIPGLLLNRLSKWSGAMVERIQSQRNDPLSTNIIQYPPAYFIRLELDINTAQEYKENIPQDKYSFVLLELIDLAFEIAEMGDIP